LPVPLIVPHAAFAYQFQGFRLEPDERLLADPSGRQVLLPPRVFDTLLYLVERPTELVSKRALMKAIWGSTIVADNSIDQAISLLRRAFKDVHASAKFIITERGRGYRFVATVTRVPRQTSAPSESDGGANEEIRRLLDEARALIVRPSADNLRGSLELLNAILERSPGFTPAIAERALLRTLFPLFDVPMANARALAEHEARQALIIEPSLARAHQALAYVLVWRGGWVEAKRHFDAACHGEQNPDAEVARVIQFSQSVGHLGLALEQARSVLDKVPLFSLAAVAYTSTCTLLGMSDEAFRSISRVAALGWPRTQAPMSDIGFLLATRRGDAREAATCAIEGLNRAIRTAGGENVIAQMCEALREPDRRGAAVAAMRRLICEVGVSGLGQRHQKRALLWLTQLGALDDAFALVHEALDHPESEGSIGGPWGWLWAPEMLPFRRDERFGEVIARFGFMEYWIRHGPPDGYELGAGGELLELTASSMAST
jgi:DNA-binding winged helix-turn-helix (wHTH) protein